MFVQTSIYNYTIKSQRGNDMSKPKKPSNRTIKFAATILEKIGIVLTTEQQIIIRKAIK